MALSTVARSHSVRAPTAHRQQSATAWGNKRAAKLSASAKSKQPEGQTNKKDVVKSEGSAGPHRRVLQFASLVGAAGLALAPFNGAALARASDFIQAAGTSSEGGKATRIHVKTLPSIPGQQAQHPQSVFDLSEHGPKFDNVKVYWTIGSSGTTSSDVQNRTGITFYKLGKSPWWNIIDKYELTINTNQTYDYFFTDEEPDTYELNVYQNAGTHFVGYSSDKPTIVGISGK